jgi:hypothetical protein
MAVTYTVSLSGATYSVTNTTHTYSISRGATGPAGMTWRGAWSGATAYVATDGVSYDGASYISILAGTNKNPATQTTYWSKIAAKGDTGPAGPSSTPEIGEIRRFPGGAPSALWRPCDGSAYLQATYPLPYAAVGLRNDFAAMSEIALGGYYITVHNCLEYGGGRFVGAGVRVGWSADNGATWTQGLTPADGDLWGDFRNVAYSASLNVWVLVGMGGVIYYSSDGGAHWTAATSSFGETGIYGVEWCGTQFIACGGSGKVATSPNGIDWTQRTSGLSWTNRSVAYSTAGAFTLIGDEQGYIIKSSNGVDWVTVASAANNGTGFCYDLAYCAAMDVFLSGDNAAASVQFSRNGTNWTIIKYEALNQYTYRVTSDGKVFYILAGGNGLVYKMGEDMVMRPMISYGAMGFQGGIAVSGVTCLVAGRTGKDYTVTKLTPSYNSATSFRVPSPSLDAGIFADSYIYFGS